MLSLYYDIIHYKYQITILKLIKYFIFIILEIFKDIFQLFQIN